MYLESSAIVATLGDLMAKGIPALPVHDSVIVPAGFELQAALALGRNWEEVTGAWPALKPVRPASMELAGTKGHGTP